MGNLNVNLISNDISFKNIEKALNFILSQKNHKSNNLNILKEIGLAKQYISVIDNKISDDKIYISKSHKTLKNYISQEKNRTHFVKWASVLFDIDEDDCNYFQNNRKIVVMKNIFLYKMFFQKNVKKNIIENASNITLFKYGIPKYLREFIWEIIIAEKYANKKYYNHKEEKEEYNSFLNGINSNNINRVQIEKDITRTFSDISLQTEKNFKMLKNLLIYTSSLTKDGYCQGMNFIVAFVLRVTNFDEIKSYYILKNIFPVIKGYFETGFPLLKKNINLFYKLFINFFPKLNSHFTKNDVFAQFWVGRWLQTLFTLSLPFDEVCYIWDLLLIKGFDFSIYICLAIVYYLEKYLMKLDDSSDILSFLKNALNPEPKYGINISVQNDIKKYIIPLKKIFSKSLKIEEKIKSDKALKQIILNSKKEDSDSIYSKNTKESDTAVSGKKFNTLDSSRYSSISSSKSINIFPKINTTIKKNPTNIKNKNTLDNKKILSYNNNFNKIYYPVNNKNKNCCANNENNKRFRLFENIDISKRNLYNNYNVNNSYQCFNLPYMYNITNPTLSRNGFFINNTLVYNPNPMAYYSNLLVCSNV